MNSRIFQLAALIAAFGILPLAAETMAATKQNALVGKYCGGCHTDALKSGGLSLQHYDAGVADPALAAMMLSKLRGGAMGAAGVGMPNVAEREAWTAATVAQSEGAKDWTVIRTDGLITASTVRAVLPREPGGGVPLYRMVMSCESKSHKGEIELTWSPQPQIERTFLVSSDHGAGVRHVLGRPAMAAAKLNVAQPKKTLIVSDLFPGETIVFPIAELDLTARQDLGMCFAAAPIR